MSVIDSSVPAPYAAAVNSSEAQRQAAADAATAAFNVPGGFEGDDPVALQAALNAASIAHFLRCIAAANANAIDAGPWIHGLKCMGRDMYGN